MMAPSDHRKSSSAHSNPSLAGRGFITSAPARHLASQLLGSPEGSGTQTDWLVACFVQHKAYDSSATHFAPGTAALGMVDPFSFQQRQNQSQGVSCVNLVPSLQQQPSLEHHVGSKPVNPGCQSDLRPATDAPMAAAQHSLL